MKAFHIYWKLQLKRYYKVLPATLLTMILVCGLLGGIALLIHLSHSDSDDIISIGIVAKEDEPYLDWIIQSAGNMESTEYTCEFILTDESDAIMKLAQGEFTAVFIIPENYIRSLIAGDADPLVIRFGEGQTGIASYLVRILGDAASRVMTDTQAGIYAMDAYYIQNHLSGRKTSEALLNISYLQQVFTREKLYVTVEAVESHTLQNRDNYFISCLVLFFLFLGMSIGRLLLSENDAMQGKLPTIGLGNTSQVMARYGALFLIYTIIYMALSLSATLFFLIWNNPLSVTDGYRMTDWLILWICMFPVLLPICSMLQCIFLWAKDTVSGVLFLFFSTLLCGYVSGYFYPSSYFSEQMQKVVSVLPTGCFRSYLAHCLSKDKLTLSAGYLLIYTMVFLCLSLLGNRRGGVRR